MYHTAQRKESLKGSIVVSGKTEKQGNMKRNIDTVREGGENGSKNPAFEKLVLIQKAFKLSCRENAKILYQK